MLPQTYGGIAVLAAIFLSMDPAARLSLKSCLVGHDGQSDLMVPERAWCPVAQCLLNYDPDIDYQEMRPIPASFVRLLDNPLIPLHLLPRLEPAEPQNLREFILKYKTEVIKMVSQLDILQVVWIGIGISVTMSISLMFGCQVIRGEKNDPDKPRQSRRTRPRLSGNFGLDLAEVLHEEMMAHGEDVDMDMDDCDTAPLYEDEDESDDFVFGEVPMMRSPFVGYTDERLPSEKNIIDVVPQITAQMIQEKAYEPQTAVPQTDKHQTDESHANQAVIRDVDSHEDLDMNEVHSDQRFPPRGTYTQRSPLSRSVSPKRNVEGTSGHVRTARSLSPKRRVPTTQDKLEEFQKSRTMSKGSKNIIRKISESFEQVKVKEMEGVNGHMEVKDEDDGQNSQAESTSDDVMSEQSSHATTETMPSDVSGPLGEEDFSFGTTVDDSDQLGELIKRAAAAAAEATAAAGHMDEGNESVDMAEAFKRGCHGKQAEHDGRNYSDNETKETDADMCTTEDGYSSDDGRKTPTSAHDSDAGNGDFVGQTFANEIKAAMGVTFETNLACDANNNQGRTKSSVMVGNISWRQLMQHESTTTTRSFSMPLDKVGLPSKETNRKAMSLVFSANQNQPDVKTVRDSIERKPAKMQLRRGGTTVGILNSAAGSGRIAIGTEPKIFGMRPDTSEGMQNLAAPERIGDRSSSEWILSGTEADEDTDDGTTSASDVTSTFLSLNSSTMKELASVHLVQEDNLFAETRSWNAAPQDKRYPSPRKNTPLAALDRGASVGIAENQARLNLPREILNDVTAALMRRTMDEQRMGMNPTLQADSPRIDPPKTVFQDDSYDPMECSPSIMTLADSEFDRDLAEMELKLRMSKASPRMEEAKTSPRKEVAKTSPRKEEAKTSPQMEGAKTSPWIQETMMRPHNVQPVYKHAMQRVESGFEDEFDEASMIPVTKNIKAVESGVKRSGITSPKRLPGKTAKTQGRIPSSAKAKTDLVKKPSGLRPPSARRSAAKSTSEKPSAGVKTASASKEPTFRQKLQPTKVKVFGKLPRPIPDRKEEPGKLPKSRPVSPRKGPAVTSADAINKPGASASKTSLGSARKASKLAKPWH